MSEELSSARERIAELEQQVERLREIVRVRTHRKNGCLCERCVETEHDISQVFQKLVDERTALTSEVERLREDAERYAFIRDHRGWPFDENPGGSTLDAAIDAVRKH